MFTIPKQTQQERIKIYILNHLREGIYIDGFLLRLIGEQAECKTVTGKILKASIDLIKFK